MISDTTNLKDFVYSDLSQVFSQAEKDYSDYPKLKKTIKNYKRSLWGFGSFYEETLKKNSFIDMLKGMKDETFCKKYTYGEMGEVGYYYLTWDIPKLKEIIKEHNIIPSLIPVADLMEEVKINNINLRTIDLNVQNTEPVIVAQHMASGTRYRGALIDGNHRVAQAYKRGDKNMLVYFVPSFLHIETLLSDLDVFLFKLAYNFQTIAEIMNVIEGANSESFKTELYDKLFKLLYKI
ncbi:hypothetical protein [Bacillus mycoides]|uniref:hypothetical protein n=1 Tax=Bacillus mycoides TaxID=1405 RepID=UPI002E1C7C54|nr:hypothetical protein [Bacillus mycoides]